LYNIFNFNRNCLPQVHKDIHSDQADEDKHIYETGLLAALKNVNCVFMVEKVLPLCYLNAIYFVNNLYSRELTC
jgi:hypothetical protein